MKKTYADHHLNRIVRVHLLYIEKRKLVLLYICLQILLNKLSEGDGISMPLKRSKQDTN